MSIRAQVGPFAMVPIWVLDRCHDSRAIHLYVVLARHANRDRRAWPKSEHLAEAMGTSLRSVERAIATLRQVGALKTERRRRVDGAVMGLDFVLVQTDPTEVEPAEVTEQPATGGGKAGPHQPATDGGVVEVLPATGVGAIPLPVAGMYKEEPDPYNQIQKPPSAAPTRARTLIDDYHDGFVQKFQERPKIDGSKDGQLLKRLAATHGPERVRELLAWFFDSSDPFIQHSGYTVGVFSACFNKLLLSRPSRRSHASARCRHADRCADDYACTQRMLHERASAGHEAHV